MTDNIIHLEESQSLQVRDYEKREIVGRIIPYNEKIEIRGRPESFVKGSVAGLDPNKTVLLRMHDPNSVVGRMTALEEREDGAYATFKVAKTSSGDELLQLADEGILDSLSAGFIAGEQSSDGVHRRIKALPEVSVVTWGAYPNAQILSVRNLEQAEEPALPKEEDLMTDENTVEDTETSSSGFDAIEQRYEELQAQLTRLQTSVEAPTQKRNVAAPKPFDWFMAEVEAINGNTEKRERIQEALETRALAHVEGHYEPTASEADADGLNAIDYLSNQLVSVIDSRRPMFRAAGKFAMPKSGYALVPTVTQHSDVDVRSAQLGEPASQEVTVSTDQYNAKWFDGALEVSLEIIQTAEIGVMQLLWNDLVGIYAKKTEAQLIADVEALSGLGDEDDLRTDTYKNFATDVASASIDVYDATGAFATKLAVPYDTWPTVVAFVDGNDRRQFTSGDHSDGNLGFNQMSFALPGGIEVFAAGVTNPLLFNEEALKVASDGPFRVEATQVTAMSRELGLIGRTMVLPRIAAGIVEFVTESS